MMATPRTRVATAAIAALLLAAFAGRAEATTSNQIWPELRLYLGITERTRIVLQTQSRLAPGSGTVTGQVGAAVETSVAPPLSLLFPTVQTSRRERVTLGLGYRYGGTIAEGSSGESQENRLLAQATFRLLLPGGLLASDRNRIEGRHLTDWSWRYRNQFELLRAFDLGPAQLAPLVRIELFYDSRYDDWSRLRIEAGADIEELVAHHTLLELYFVRQYDRYSQPSIINGAGITFEIFR